MKIKTVKFHDSTNNAPYRNERPYNDLRLALNLVKREDVQGKVEMLVDSVFCAHKNQKTPVRVLIENNFGEFQRRLA